MDSYHRCSFRAGSSHGEVQVAVRIERVYQRRQFSVLTDPEPLNIALYYFHRQLTKMSRLYRLRGLAMRGFRALLLLELINRMLGVPPEKQLRRLREQLREKEKEVAALRTVIVDLEKLIAAQKEEEAAQSATGLRAESLSSEPKPGVLNDRA